MSLKAENFNIKKYLNQSWLEDCISSNFSSPTASSSTLVQKNINSKTSVALYYYHYLFNQKKCADEMKFQPLYKMVFNQRVNSIAVTNNNNGFNKNTNKKSPNSYLKPILKKRNVKEMRFRNYGLHRNLENGLISCFQQQSVQQLLLGSSNDTEKC